MKILTVSAAAFAAFFMAPMAVSAEGQIVAPLVLAKETKSTFSLYDFPWGLPEGRTEDVTLPLGEAAITMPWMEFEKVGEDHVMITAPAVTVSLDTDEGVHEFAVMKTVKMLVRLVDGAMVMSGDAGTIAIEGRDDEGSQAKMAGVEFVFTSRDYDLAVKALKSGAKSGSEELKTAMRALNLVFDYSAQSMQLSASQSGFEFKASSGPSHSSIVFGDGRLAVSAEGVRSTFEADAPIPGEGKIGQMSYGFSMPTEASETVQPMQFGFEVSDVSASDAVWDLVDPKQVFPRELKSATVDATLDIIAVNSMFDSARVRRSREPFETVGGRLTTLEFDGLGLDVSAKGDVEMDGEVPKDVSAFLSVAGLSEFMKNVVKAGFVPQSQAIFAEGIALQFATEEPDGRLTFDLKTEDGIISINGNRVAPLPK